MSQSHRHEGAKITHQEAMSKLAETTFKGKL